MKRTNGNTPRQVQHYAFPACVCFFLSSFPGSSLRVKAVILGTHCLFLWFVPLYLFHCRYLRLLPAVPFSCVFFHTQNSPISKQTDVSIPARGAGSDVRRVCLHVDVSTLIQTPLFSSHLSAPDVALGVKMDLCSRKKKGRKQHISLFVETDRYTLKFNSGIQEEMSPIQCV